METIYRVGVIGTGFAEKVTIPALQRHARFEVVALAARNPEKTRAVAERLGIPHWYTDWQALLARDDLDAVAIVTPPYLHHEMTMAALEANLHVLCEKPMALNANQALDMWRMAQKRNRTAMICHEFRYLPARQAFGELVQQGVLGTVRRVLIQSHMDVFADPMRPWSWWSDASRGGGMLGAIGSHYFDALHHWFGRLPVRVWGRLSTFIRERPTAEGEMRPVTSDDAAMAVVEYDDGGQAVFDLMAVAVPRRESLVVAVGSEGTIMLEGDTRVRVARKGETFTEYPVPALEREPDEHWLLAPFMRLLDDFAWGIEKEASPSPNFYDGLAHQLFLDAVHLSEEVRSWVPYDLDDFIAQQEA